MFCVVLRQVLFRAQKPLNGTHISDSKWLAWATLMLPYRRPWLSSEYKEAIWFDKVAPVSYKIPVNFWEKVAPSTQPLIFSPCASDRFLTQHILHPSPAHPSHPSHPSQYLFVPGLNDIIQENSLLIRTQYVGHHGARNHSPTITNPAPYQQRHTPSCM